jgi:hypothetical protein
VLALTAKLHVLKPLGVTPATRPHALDVFVTKLLIRVELKSVNSILKFLKYKKEDGKNEPVARTSSRAGATSIDSRFDDTGPR